MVLTPRIADDIRAMGRSGIRQVMDLAGRREDCIHLELGEPDFGTPDHVVQAAFDAVRAGATRYTPNAGIPELREAVTAKVQKRNGITADPEQAIITHGAVQAILTTFRAVATRGDEILIPDPGWPNYAMMARMLGVVPVGYPLEAEEGFVPDPSRIEAAITPRTRALVINSPSNPLGTVIPAPALERLVELAERRGLWLISDECYDEIYFGDPPASAAAVRSSANTVSVFSFSKTYAMTGWRVGYAIAPPELAPQLYKLQEPVISCVSAPSQHAALAALGGPQTVVRAMRDAYRERRDAAVDLLRRRSVPHVPPEGAFYLWVRADGLACTPQQFSLDLLEQHAVATVPGDAFGAQGGQGLRVSLASDRDEVLEGLRRLADAFDERRET